MCFFVVFVAAMPMTMACIDECGVGVDDSDCEWSGKPMENNLGDSDGELDASFSIEDAVVSPQVRFS